MIAARKKLSRRQRRNRIAAAIVLLLVAAIPLASSVRSRRDHRMFRDFADVAKPGWQVQWSDDALAYQLVQTGTPRSAGDYLLPNAAALSGFTSSYGEVSWQYAPQWTYNP
jgi:hypothetical protein